MSEFKGTKGKWEIRPTSVLNEENKPLFYDIVIDGSGFISTHKNEYIEGMSNMQQEANAKLIVCAPEMLKELEKAKSTISRLKNSMRAHPDCVEDSEFADYVDLAEFNEDSIELLIKKATE